MTPPQYEPEPVARCVCSKGVCDIYCHEFSSQRWFHQGGPRQLAGHGTIAFLLRNVLVVFIYGGILEHFGL